MTEEFKYNRLEGKIKEILGSNSILADKLGMKEATLSKKLNNKSSFKQKEMKEIMKLLNEPETMIPVYFFTLKVQETKQNDK